MPFVDLCPKLNEVLKNRGIIDPTDPQKDAVPKILDGKNILVVAPTGIGKTESAMLPIFDILYREGSGAGIECIYVTPLRALNRDMLKRMESMGSELGITVGIRHGDTSSYERQKQSKNPPRILITTPETLQVLFIGKNLRKHLEHVRWVVIDEIHELAGNERGAQLAVALERLVRLSGEFQRIGLSATVGNTDAVIEYLVGAGRTAILCKHDSHREFSITVECPVLKDDQSRLKDKLQSDPDILAVMIRAKELMDSVKSALLFVNTRETAEWIGSRYHMWDESYPIEVHHGSLSKEIRMETEDRFKNGERKALICTSSLELGIDIGSADLVIQYNSPRRVARMTQRAGRAGHRIGGKIRAEVLATAPDELAEAMVIARRCEAKLMETNVCRNDPLSVLANQIVAMTMEGEVKADDVYSLVRRSHPFKDLDRKTFDDTLSQLQSVKMVMNYEGVLKKSRKGMNYFFENISMIPDEKTYLVRNIATRGIIGTLDENFVAALESEGEMALFISKGRTWRIIEQREDELLVEEARTLGTVPAWVGSDIPVPFEVAMEVGGLRRLRNFDDYPADEAAVSKVSEYLDDQAERWVMPSDRVITVESGNRLAIINCCFGSRVNDTLSKIVSALLMARMGESIGISTDAYRIILSLPHDVPIAEIVEVLKSVKPGTVEAYCRLTIMGSSYLKWRFINVAKKFGIIEKGADRRYVNYSRLFDLHRDTPAFNDSINKVLEEDLDIPNTELVLRRIACGDIEIACGSLSRIGLEGITATKELMQPARADHAILEAMRKRLEDEVLYASCIRCKTQRRARVGEIPRKVVCSKCGGTMVALLKDYERDDFKKFDGPGANPAINRRIKKNANLVNSYGGGVALVLAGRGIGPDTAARIMSKMHTNEDSLIRDIMASEINYAKTKQFWD